VYITVLKNIKIILLSWLRLEMIRPVELFFQCTVCVVSLQKSMQYMGIGSRTVLQPSTRSKVLALNPPSPPCNLYSDIFRAVFPLVTVLDNIRPLIEGFGSEYLYAQILYTNRRCNDLF
jgi:hypothetical protein